MRPKLVSKVKMSISQNYKTPLVWSWKSFLFQSMRANWNICLCIPCITSNASYTISEIFLKHFVQKLLKDSYRYGLVCSWGNLCVDSVWELCAWLLNGFCIIILFRNLCLMGTWLSFKYSKFFTISILKTIFLFFNFLQKCSLYC